MIVYESDITTIPSGEIVHISITPDTLPTGCEYWLPTGRWAYTNNALDENENVGFNLIFDEQEHNKIRAEMYNDGLTDMVITVSNLKQFDVEVKILLINFDNIN